MEFDDKVPSHLRYANAQYALEQIANGAATGDKWRLHFRSAIERGFGALGALIGRLPFPVIASVVVICSVLAFGLSRARFETNEYKLWTETGGRLEDEIDYSDRVLGEGSVFSNELVIQVGRDGRSAISVEALDEHLDLVKYLARNVTVEMWDSRWGFTDLCYNIKPPSTQVYGYLDGIFTEMNPCTVLSVLDCFWDGSLVHDRKLYHLKVDGTDLDQYVSWSSMDPHELLDAMKETNADELVLRSLRDAGFDGYVRKHCLHPSDPRCPQTAPNKDNETENIDPEGIIEALTKTCTGFASAAAKWPSPLIVSGDDWKEGKGSHALQAIFTLHSQQKIVEMLTEYQLKYPNSTLGKMGNLSLEDASTLLKKWRKEFVKVVYDREDVRIYTDAHAWTTDSARQIIEKYSWNTLSLVLVVLGYFFMILYAGLAFFNIKSLVRKSRFNVGIVGVLLVVLSCVAGLGLASLCGLPFNASTTQVLPFLVLGLGVDDMFVMAHTFFTIFDRPGNRHTPMHKMARECLERVGLSVTLTSVTNSAGFFLAAIIPIPAMRDFALQVGICVAMNYFIVLLAFPAYLCIDGRRIRSGLIDVCCCGVNMLMCLCHHEVQEFSEKPQTKSDLQLDGIPKEPVANGVYSGTNGVSSGTTVTVSRDKSKVSKKGRSDGQSWGDWFVRDVYAPFLLRRPVKFVVILIACILFGTCMYGATLVENGLDLTEVVPSGTKEHDYISLQLKYFSFFDLYIVQDDKNNYSSLHVQKEMLELHSRFASVPWIVTTDRKVNSKKIHTVSETFWLEKMIDFYVQLQKEYDHDIATNQYSYSSLLVDNYFLPQVGNGMYDFDLLEDKQRKLYDNSTGRPLIPEDRFYVYLSAWTSIDVLHAEATQPSFRPLVPKWPVAEQLNITPAQPMVYAQMPLYSNGVNTSASHIELIKQVRQIVDEARSRGVSAYPRGIPFIFYEQYIGLQNHLYLAVGMILLACLITTSVLLLSVWSGIIMVAMLAVTAIEVYGFLGLANIQFSAIPCVTVIVSVGATVEFTAPLCLMFVKIIGTREERVQYALHHRFVPIFNGAVSTFVGFIMLAFSEFEFIIKYFLVIFIALLIAATFNGLVLLPVVLSWIGPLPQVVPIACDDTSVSPHNVARYLHDTSEVHFDTLPKVHCNNDKHDGTPV